MSTVIRRVLAASIPAALLASGTMATIAAPGIRALPRGVVPLGGRPFGVRPFASSTTLYAGGATLPIIGYVGKAVGSGGSSLPVAGSGSIFAYFGTLSSGAPIDYCATGSGKGKGVIDGPSGTVSNPCANAASGATGTVGFNPGTTAITPFPAFAGTDSPLAQSDYSTFVTDAGGRVEPTQIPTIVGSVGIYYHNSSISSSTQAKVTSAQLCGIVSGTITNWNQLGYPAKTLKLVYRADGSGTSFSFSNHLSAYANAACTGLNASQQFAPTATVTSGTVVKAAPPNSIGASGNGGVASTVAANDGAIGYVETANAIAAGVTNSKQLALVDGKDALKNLPQAANSIPTSGLLTDRAIVAGNGKASTTALTGVSKAGCVRVFNPQAYSLPSAGYPIVAVTNLVFNEANNNANSAGSVTELRSLVGVIESSSSYGPGKITKVDPVSSTTGTTGYSELPTAFASTLTTTATNCIN